MTPNLPPELPRPEPVVLEHKPSLVADSQAPSATPPPELPVLDASFPIAAEDPFAGPLTAEDHFTAWLDKIADALAGPGYLVLDGLLPETLLTGLCEALDRNMLDDLRPAGIGRPRGSCRSRRTGRAPGRPARWCPRSPTRPGPG